MLGFARHGKNAQSAKTSPSGTSPRDENAERLLECARFLSALLKSDQFIARSDYSVKLDEYSQVIESFTVLQKSGVLADYCKKNRLDQANVERILQAYRNAEAHVDKHNEEFVSAAMLREKDYLDHVLYDVDPNIVLDEDQRRVILTDEDYTLVIAGAGAGKTTTVAAKVKYLVDRQGIDPNQILVISFTNKAVNELKDRIQKDLKIPCIIATFHSTGNTIIHMHEPDEKPNIVDQGQLYYIIRDYFRNSVMRNESAVKNLILFFATYFDAPYEGDDLNSFFNNIAKANFSTMRSDLEDFKREVIDARTKKSETIQNEVLRSHQEVEIANFLYLNNIDYEYEPIYPYNIQFARKPYTPDFILQQDEKVAYIEHFGITQSGQNDRFTPEEIERYKNAIKDKIRIHQQHGTTLIYTFSAYDDRQSLTTHLKQELEAKGFELRPRSNKEVMETIVAGEENRYVRKLVNLICRFISNFKVNGYQLEDFSRMSHSTRNPRSRLFLDICADCYLEYESWLKENNAVDFEDMINESARILNEVKEMKQKLHLKYIIVDEYQDISRQRFDLTKALSEVTDAKIIAVGDDWQSIYAFSGSDITLFTKFAEKMGYAKMMKIVRTYRNSQDVIDIAGNFIQKNTEQIPKHLISEKHIDDPVIIYTYDGKAKARNADRRSGVNYAMAKAVETALEALMEYKKREQTQPGPILLLGRFNFDGDLLERSGLFELSKRGDKIKSVKYPKLDITFMTAHSSKGLGYDDVILINGRNEMYGFPSKIEDDPVLAFVIKGDRSIDYAEERRLFYVAMTRTKNRVFMVAPEQNPSEFLIEIKREYKNVRLEGSWDENYVYGYQKKTCPICGYPMQFKYKRAYGLKLYICSNEPEICGFMTNDLHGGKMSIQKCEKCRDGYLIVKSREQSYFLGCTNYASNGTGCDKVISMKDYYDQMHYAYEESSQKPQPMKPAVRQIGFQPATEQDSKQDSKQPRYTKSPAGQIGFRPPSEEKSQTDSRTQQTASQEQKMPPEQHLDYVSIKRASIPPVMFEEWDLNEVVFTIVKALQNASEKRFHNLKTLTDVLSGTESERVVKNQLGTVPEFRALQEMPYDTIQAIIEWMITQHLILKTRERYPVLHSTYDGLHYSEFVTEGKLKKLKKYLEEEVVLWM